MRPDEVRYAYWLALRGRPSEGAAWAEAAADLVRLRASWWRRAIARGWLGVRDVR